MWLRCAGNGPADVLNMSHTSSEYGTSMIIPYNVADNKTYTLQWWSYGSGFGDIEYFACMDLRIKAKSICVKFVTCYIRTLKRPCIVSGLADTP